jgi:hypothetical protein
LTGLSVTLQSGFLSQSVQLLAPDPTVCPSPSQITRRLPAGAGELEDEPGLLDELAPLEEVVAPEDAPPVATVGAAAPVGHGGHTHALAAQAKAASSAVGKTELYVIDMMRTSSTSRPGEGHCFLR